MAWPLSAGRVLSFRNRSVGLLPIRSARAGSGSVRRRSSPLARRLGRGADRVWSIRCVVLFGNNVPIARCAGRFARSRGGLRLAGCARPCRIVRPSGRQPGRHRVARFNAGCHAPGFGARPGARWLRRASARGARPGALRPRRAKSLASRLRAANTRASGLRCASFRRADTRCGRLPRALRRTAWFRFACAVIPAAVAAPFPGRRRKRRARIEPGIDHRARPHR